MARRSSESVGAEFGRRHPVLASVLVAAALAGIIVMFVAKLVLSRQVAPAGWAPGAAVGAAVSIALLTLTITVARVRTLRHTSPRILWVVALFTVADFWCALATRVSSSSSRVIVTIDAAATAYMIPVLAAMVLLISWSLWTVTRRRRASSTGRPRRELRSVPSGYVLSMSDEELLSAAVEIVTSASRLAAQCFIEGAPASTKADGSEVTSADVEVEELIREQIAARFPDDSVLGEEQGETAGDPMDYWDVVPRQVLLTEAGGRVTDLDGNDVRTGNGTVLASNGHLHDALLELVRGIPDARDYQAIIRGDA